MSASSFNILAIINYSIVVILPAVSFYIFIDTNDNDQRDLRFLIFTGIFALSFVPVFINRVMNNALYKDQVLLLNAWRSVALVYLLLCLWNYVFVLHIQDTGYVSDIFRDRFWKYYSPFYGIPENFSLNDILLVLVPGTLFFVAVYYLDKRSWLSGRSYLLAILIIFYLVFFSAFALTESTTRLYGAVNDYSHYFMTADLQKFTGVQDIFSNWTLYMSTLEGRFNHYPPGYFIVQYYEQLWQMEGVLKVLVVLLAAGTAILLYYLSLLVGFGKDTAILAPVLLLLSPGLIIQASTATSPLTMALTLCVHVLLLAGIMQERKSMILASAFIFFIYSLFSFIIFTSFLLTLVILLFACYYKALSFSKTIYNLFIFLAAFLFFHVALFILTGFNLLECLLIAIPNNSNLITIEGPFDNITRYLIRSSGNLLAYVGFSGVIIAALVFAGLKGVHGYPALMRSHVVGFVVALVLISFSSLFYMETERIWVFLAPVMCLAAAAMLLQYKQLSSPAVMSVLVGLYLGSAIQEIIFLHYLWKA